MSLIKTSTKYLKTDSYVPDLFEVVDNNTLKLIPSDRFIRWQISSALYEARLVSLPTRILIDEEFSDLIWALPSHSIIGIYILGEGRGKVSMTIDVFRASQGVHTMELSDSFPQIVDEFTRNAFNLVVVTRDKGVVDRAPLGSVTIWVSDTGVECRGCANRLQPADFKFGRGVMAGSVIPSDCFLTPWPLAVLRGAIPDHFLNVSIAAWKNARSLESRRVIGVNYETHLSYCVDYLTMMLSVYSEFPEQPYPIWDDLPYVKPVHQFDSRKLSDLVLDGNFWCNLLGHSKKWSRAFEARLVQLDDSLKNNLIYRFLLFAYRCVGPRLLLNRPASRPAIHFGEVLVICSSLFYQGDLEEAWVIANDLSAKVTGTKFAGIGKCSAEYVNSIPKDLFSMSVKANVAGHFWLISAQLSETEFECGPYYPAKTDYVSFIRDNAHYLKVNDINALPPHNLKSPVFNSRKPGHWQQPPKKTGKNNGIESAKPSAQGQVSPVIQRANGSVQMQKMPTVHDLRL